MAQVRSKMLYAGLIVTSAATTLYVTPPGRTTIVQYLTMYRRGTNSGPCRILVRPGASSIAVVRLEGTELYHTHIDTWIVLPENGALLVDGATNGGDGWWITASGAELLGVPPPAIGTLPHDIGPLEDEQNFLRR